MRKIRPFFSLLLKDPVEFYDRAVNLLEQRMEQVWVRPPAYKITSLEEAVRGVEMIFGWGVGYILGEKSLAEIQGEVRRGIKAIRCKAPFSLACNADFALAQFCYLICRALKPNIVLETGVAYGVTSAFILKALEMNRRGILHSIDLPPLVEKADQFVGILIPGDLKGRWILHRGVSTRVLPRLLPMLGQVNVFIHDSLHTYRNMQLEFRLVTPYLSPKAVLIADDVERNLAFQKWVSKFTPIFSCVIREKEKEKLFGIALRTCEL